MRVWSLMLFILCMNMSAFILNASGTYPASKQLWITPTDMTSQFGLTIFAGMGLGGALVGIIALMTRQYTYAIFALIIWIGGILLPVAQWFLAGVPIMLASLLPNELWYISSALEALILVIFFMFFVELFSQRQIT